MPNYTEKLNLEKPLGTEDYDIEVHNSNMQKIDDYVGTPDPTPKITQAKPIGQVGGDSYKDSVVDSPAGLFEYYSDSVVQSFTNNDGSDGTTNWNTAGTLNIVDGNFVAVSSAVQFQRMLYRQMEFIKSNDEFGVTLILETNNDIALVIREQLASGTIYKERFLSSGFHKVSLKGTSLTNNPFFYITNTTTNITTVTIKGFGSEQGINGINLTALNKETYTEQEVFDRYGIKALAFGFNHSEGDIVVTGKNQFDKNDTLSDTSLSTLGVEFANVGYKASGFIPVLSNTSYYINEGFISSGNRRCFYDSSENFISSESPIAGTFTTPSNCAFVRTVVKLDVMDIDTLQLELGTTATDYEAYRPQTLSHTGKSVPSARDYYNMLTGEFLPKVAPVDDDKYLLVNADIPSIFTGYTNVDAVRLNYTNLDGVIIPPSIDTTNTDMTIEGFSPLNGGTVDSVDSEYKHFKDNANIFLIVPKGEYIDASAARTDLVTNKKTGMIYELDGTQESIQLGSKAFDLDNKGTIQDTSKVIGDTVYIASQNLADTVDNIGNALVQVEEESDRNNTQSLTPLTISVVGQAITVDIPVEDKPKFMIEVETLVTGGPVTLNGLPLFNDYELTEQTNELEPNVYDVLKKKGIPAFFVASKGRGNITWLQQYTGANEILKDEKDKDVKVQIGEYVYNEFYEIKIQGDGSQLISNPDVDTWDEKLKAPSEQTKYLGSIGGKIYSRRNASTYGIWSYDIQSNSWVESLAVPSTFWDFLIELGTDFYVRGNASGQIWKYDTLLDSWDETLASASVQWSEGISIGTDVYVRKNSAPYNYFKYDTAGDTWDETLAAPSGTHSSPVKIGTDIFSFSLSGQVWKYDTLLDTWDETLATPSNVVNYSVAVGTDIYVRNGALTTQIWKYDTLLDSWNETLASASGVWEYSTSEDDVIYTIQANPLYALWKYDPRQTVDYQIIPPTTKATAAMNLQALIDGTLEMANPETDQVYQGFKSKIDSWAAGMEGARPSNIKSQQRISFPFAGGLTTDNVVIAPVDYDISDVEISTILNSSGADDSSVRAVLAFDGSSVTLTKGATGSNLEVEIVVTEYNNVKDKQTVTLNNVSPAGTPGIVNTGLTTLDPLKCKVSSSHYTDNPNNDIDGVFINPVLTASNMQHRWWANGWNFWISTTILEFK